MDKPLENNIRESFSSFSQILTFFLGCSSTTTGGGDLDSGDIFGAGSGPSSILIVICEVFGEDSILIIGGPTVSTSAMQWGASDVGVRISRGVDYLPITGNAASSLV